MNVSKHALSLALLAAGISSSSAFAQAAETSQVERIIVTATQTKHTELTAPASVSIITAEDIAKQAVNNLADVLKAVTSIDVIPTTAYGRSDISIRGMDSKYTLILINGKRVNSHAALIRGNDFDLGSVPISAIQRVEVVRGPMSSLYGSEALGGVVNVILKQPSEQTQGSISLNHETMTSGDGGSQNKLNGYISGQLSDDISALMVVEHTDRDAWRAEDYAQFDALEKRTASQVLTELDWQLAKNQTVTASALISSDEREADWQRGPNIEKTQQETDRLNLSVSHQAEWDALNTDVRYFYETVDLSDASTAYETGDIEQVNHTLDFKGFTSLADHHITFGAEYRSTELTNPRDLVADNISNNQNAFFVQDEFAMGDLAITLGGRLGDHQVFGSEFSPRIYGVYSLNENLTFKAGWGEAFKAPGMLEMSEAFQLISCRGACWLRGNADLNPETSDTAELGFVYSSAANSQTPYGISLTTYKNKIAGKIDRDVTVAVGDIDGTPVVTYHNLGQAEVNGTELQAWVDVSKQLSFEANVTFTDAKDTSTGDRLTGTPDKNASLKVNWQATDALSSYLQYAYTGEQLIGTATVDAYNTVNLGGGYTVNEQIKVRLGVSNLTDESFGEEVISYGYFLKGRSVFADLTFSF
ncbi:TonB-dependent receptor domain-containing protein [Algibacillus agarilyticus]|uniref:TonB-dependent receptor domain-containing protein n=1 Tax=Algibacillus agarilyticus TaxID=2234133 RepID=UPI000DD04653|nr:TonB-dependent receptor [Algibacillus agarilyticus]